MFLQVAAWWDCEPSGHCAVTWDGSLSPKPFVTLLESHFKESPGHCYRLVGRLILELFKNTNGQEPPLEFLFY